MDRAPERGMELTAEKGVLNVKLDDSKMRRLGTQSSVTRHSCEAKDGFSKTAGREDAFVRKLGYISKEHQ